MKILSALTLLLFLSISCNHDDKNDRVKPALKDITESVYASLKLSPEIFYSPQSIRSGIIKKVYVSEGELVKKGQILFEITPTEDVKSQLTTAELNLQEAKSNYLGNNNLLKNINLEIQTTKDQLALDSINFKRQENLWAQNIGKKLDYEQLKLKFQATQKQYEILKQKYVQTKISLENNYQKALNRTRTERSQLSDYIIRSEIDGKVYSINKEEGDLISSQEAFGEIGTADTYKLLMDIDEVDIAKIKTGDTAYVVLDALPSKVFQAKIDQILPKKDERTQTFRAEGSFINAPDKLYNGLSGEANIVIAKRTKAMVIPAGYLLPNNRVKTTEGEKEIQTGIKNLEFVEVISGIDSTDTLIKPTEDE